MPTQFTTPDQIAIMAVIREGFAAFSRGDFVAFMHIWHPEVDAMINQAAPYVWTGEGVVARWLADSAREARGDGAEGRGITAYEPWRLDVTEEGAFLVLPVTMHFTRGGQRFEEKGTQISVLARTADGWRVKSLAYGGQAAAAV